MLTGKRLRDSSKCNNSSCEASILLNFLRSHIEGMTTGGRNSDADSAFLDRLAFVFGRSTVPRYKISVLTGLTDKRIRKQSMSDNGGPRKKKKRADAATPEDFAVVDSWLKEVCRRSADKTNMVTHKKFGPHLVFYKTFSYREGYDLFKKSNPKWNFGRTIFNDYVQSVYWLKNPRNSTSLCQVCSNMRLFLQAVHTFEKKIGCHDDDVITVDMYDFVGIITCPPPSPAPPGQHDLYSSDCGLNTCQACIDGGTYMQRHRNQICILGDGMHPTAQQWTKVEKFTQDGARFEATERKMITFSSPDTFFSDFLVQTTAFKEHFHEWHFQQSSERFMREDIMEGKARGIFHYYFDLSENYKLQYQWAPHATYWGSKDVTLATAVGFYSPLRGERKLVKLEIFCLSEALNHNSDMTTRCQREIEKWFLTKFPDCEMFRIFVDNAPQHYRTNRYVSAQVDAVENDHITRDLHYWGKYHGKTVGDSAGGNLKKWLDNDSVRKECRDLRSLCDHINSKYKKHKNTSKVDIRQAIFIPMRAAQCMRITARTVRHLNNYYNYSVAWDDTKARALSSRRYLSCVCTKCSVGDFDNCCNQQVGAAETIYD